MATGLAPLWDTTYISCSGIDISIVLESIHRFRESMNPFIRCLFLDLNVNKVTSCILDGCLILPHY